MLSLVQNMAEKITEVTNKWKDIQCHPNHPIKNWTKSWIAVFSNRHVNDQNA